jgi:hypothetical protein
MTSPYVFSMQTYRVGVKPSSKAASTKRALSIPASSEISKIEGFVDPNEFDLPLNAPEKVQSQATSSENRFKSQGEDLTWLDEFKAQILAGKPCVAPSSKPVDLTTEVKAISEAKTSLQRALRNNSLRLRIRGLILLIDTLQAEQFKLKHAKEQLMLRLMNEFCKTGNVNNLEQTYEHTKRMCGELTKDNISEMERLTSRHANARNELRGLHIPALDVFLDRQEDLYSKELDGLVLNNIPTSGVLISEKSEPISGSNQSEHGEAQVLKPFTFENAKHSENEKV